MEKVPPRKTTKHFFTFFTLPASFHSHKVDYIWTCSDTLEPRLMDGMMVNNCELQKYPWIIRMKKNLYWKILSQERRIDSLKKVLLLLIGFWLEREKRSGQNIVYSHHSFLWKFYLIFDSLHSAISSVSIFGNFPPEPISLQKEISDLICSLKHHTNKTYINDNDSLRRSLYVDQFSI